MKREIWRPIDEANGLYEVSNRGRVRSLDRWMPHGKSPTGRAFYRGKVLTSKFADGYPMVALRLGDGKSRFRTIHRLVAKAFIPNPNNYPMVRHLDDNPIHNFEENLAWGTQRDNTLDLKCWNCGAPYHKRPKRHRRKRKYA